MESHRHILRESVVRMYPGFVSLGYGRHAEVEMTPERSFYAHINWEAGHAGPHGEAPALVRKAEARKDVGKRLDCDLHGKEQVPQGYQVQDCLAE